MKKYSETYNSNYYDTYDSAPYRDEQHWMPQFQMVANEIVEQYHPQRTLDIGCAYGYLVAALRDKGVDAYGLDVSDHAISQVREDVKPFCAVGDATQKLPENLPDRYDLVTCIEMIEHLYEEDTERFITAICSMTDRVVLSSTDSDYDDPTHVNVQKQEYWAKRFAAHGFIRDVFASNLNISGNTMVFEKTDVAVPSVIEYYEHKLRLSDAAFRNKVAESESVIRSKEASIECLKQQTEEYVTGNRTLCEENGKLEAELEEHKRELEERDNRLQEKNRELEELDYELQAKNRSLEEQDCALQERNRKLEEQDCALQEKDCMLNKLNLELEECTREAECVRHESEEIEKERDRWVTIACERYNIITDMQAAKRIADANFQNLQNSLNEFQMHYHYVTHSIYWKVTAPIRWFVFSLKSILKRTPIIRKFWPYLVVWRRQGYRAMKNYRKEVKQGKCPAPCIPQVQTPTHIQTVAPEESSIPLITGHPIDPIMTVYTGEDTKRINLVTDSLNADSLLGGTATALICATKLAKAFGYELRIITRNADADPVAYWNNIKINGVDAPEKVSFYSDYWRKQPNSAPYKMEIGTNEVFFATSWWSATAIRATQPQSRLIYIVQEVETFFYNYGCEHLLCSRVMEDPNIDFIVNSHYLNDYFKAECPNITDHGCWFEPAFQKDFYKCKGFTKKEKYKLFFYARPNNPRNLFQIGVHLLDKAIAEGVLDTNEWDIYCVGQSAPELTFSNGSKSINLGQLSWEEYAEFLSDVDIGLCLMYTPHPSYPPYDVACSGGVVITNKMLNKQSFNECDNIVLIDLVEGKSMEGFAEAIALAKDMQRRKKNYEQSRICRDWNTAMEPVISFMKGKL